MWEKQKTTEAQCTRWYDKHRATGMHMPRAYAERRASRCLSGHLRAKLKQMACSLFVRVHAALQRLMQYRASKLLRLVVTLHMLHHTANPFSALGKEPMTTSNHAVSVLQAAGQTGLPPPSCYTTPHHTGQIADTAAARTEHTVSIDFSPPPCNGSYDGGHATRPAATYQQ